MKVNLPLVVAAAFVLAACATPSDDGADSGSGGKTAVTSSSSASTPVSPTPTENGINGIHDVSWMEVIEIVCRLAYYVRFFWRIWSCCSGYSSGLGVVSKPSIDF